MSSIRRGEMNCRDVSPTGVRDLFDMRLGNKERLIQYCSLNCNSTLDIVKEDLDIVKEDKVTLLKRQIERTRQSLQQVESQRLQDRRNLHQRKIEAKALVRQQLKEKYSDVFARGTSLKQRRQEVQKITQFLKKDNARIRCQIRDHQQKIRELKAENAKLEQTTKGVEAAVVEVRKYIQTAEQTNERLVQYVETYKTKLKEVKNSLTECDAHYNVEFNHANKYERSIDKLSRRISKKCRRRDLKLSLSIGSLVHDANHEAMTSRSKEIDHVDTDQENLTRRQRKSLQNLEKQLSQLSFGSETDEEITMCEKKDHVLDQHKQT